MVEKAMKILYAAILNALQYVRKNEMMQDIMSVTKPSKKHNVIFT